MTKLSTNLSVDHVGVGVRELEKGRVAYARLGFQLTPLSLHAGTGPDGRLVSWGSGNHCAMFHAGYLEVLGQVEAGGQGRIAQMVARYEGMHITALGCKDADATYEVFRARGAPVEPIMVLERDAPFGPKMDQLRRAKFRLVGFDRTVVTESRVQCTEHQTPEVLWQPHLLDHPNGVQSIDEVFFQCADPQAVAERFGDWLDAEVGSDDISCRVKLARGAWRFVRSEDCAKLFGAASTLPVPAPVGIVLSVKSVADTRAWLKANGVATHDFQGGGLVIAATDACGAALVLTGKQ